MGKSRLSIHTKTEKRKTGISNLWLKIILAIVIALPYLGLWGVRCMYNQKFNRIANARFIIVDKEQMSLHLIDYQGEEVCSYGICCGRNYGNKHEIGDMKTPEGIFRITDIEDASTWSHDFKDGNGRVEGAYGPWFLRLAVPGHKGIGIHGTHKPQSIGTRDTEGCIRLNNSDITDLKTKVNKGMVVIVLPSYVDLIVSHQDSLASLNNKPNLSNKKKKQ